MKCAVVVAMVMLFAPEVFAGDPAEASGHPWPAEKAWQWYEQQPWLCGFNYIPATAINYTEMWQKETFDPKTIDEELVKTPAPWYCPACLKEKDDPTP